MSDTHLNGRGHPLGERRERSMEKAPEKQPLDASDYIEIAGMYFILEAQLNALMVRAAALQDHLHARSHRAWMEPHGTDALCTPLSDAYALLGQAKSSILASHAYASKTAKHLGIEPLPEGDVQTRSGGGCKGDAPPPGP